MVVRPLDHTADVGFELEAESLEGLFQAALAGLLQVMFQNPPKGERGGGGWSWKPRTWKPYWSAT